MTQTINTRLSLPLLLVVTAGAPANAQVAGSLDRLALLVDAGDRVTVTDDTGRERSGSPVMGRGFIRWCLACFPSEDVVLRPAGRVPGQTCLPALSTTGERSR